MYPKPMNKRYARDLMIMVGMLSIVAMAGLLYGMIAMQQKGARVGRMIIRYHFFEKNKQLI
jgi:hypothetical protein